MTPDDARLAVYEHLTGEWQGAGTLVVQDVFEDDRHFAVGYGNREYVEGDDVNFMLLDAPVALVEKKTGRVSFLSLVGNERRIDAMRPVRTH